jgi:hypothetical protein
MGTVKNIRADHFPRQSEHIGARVEVCFQYDLTQTVNGTVVRDDMEAPWRMIIRLDDGRHVLATECQYSF